MFRSPNKFCGPATALAWLAGFALLQAQNPSLAPQANPGKIIFEEWSVLFLDGKQCGFESTLTTQIDTPGGPQFHTAAEEDFVMKRGGAAMKLIETSEVTEDADGGVLSFKLVSSGSGSNIESDGVRDGDTLVVSSRGQTEHYPIARLSAFGPEKVRRLIDAVPLKPGQTYSFPSFACDYPQAVVQENGTIIRQEDRNVRGVSRKLWKVTSETSEMPGLLSTAWVDDQGNDVEGLTVIPGIGDMREYVTDRAECMKQPEGAEIFTTSLIHPQRAIPSPEDQAQVVYRLTVDDPGKKLSLWSGAGQQVLSSAAGTCDVEVTPGHFTAGDATYQLPHAESPELHPYLQASSYLEVDAPIIQTLARKAAGPEKNPVIAAMLIEDFVRDYITRKDFNVGFASAEETAQSREGDCTEHAVLCAALGRAAGMPTRCVIGLGYIPPGEEIYGVSQSVDQGTGTFGFHMWAEAWIGPDEWVPMDAAMGRFDVGHIAIIKTALEEINPLLDLNAPILQLMQNLRIDVLKTVPKEEVSSLSRSSTAPSHHRAAEAPSPPPAQRPTLPPLD